MDETSPQPLSDFAQNYYLAYPHSNCFAYQGRTVVLGNWDNQRFSLILHDLAGDEADAVIDLSQCGEFGSKSDPFYDVALDTNRVSFIAGNSVWILDLNDARQPKMVYRAKDGETILGLPSIKRSGSHVLAPVVEESSYAVREINCETGEVHTPISKSWWSNHYHYSPFDESWIGFCHEGATETIPRRVWAYHPQEAPEGRCAFDQKWDNLKTRVCAGHERWAFHDRSVYIVGYGVSPGRPRGIYEAFVDGRPSRLSQRRGSRFPC